MRKYAKTEDAKDKSGYKLFKFVLMHFAEKKQNYPFDKFCKVGAFKSNAAIVLNKLASFESGDIKNIAVCFKLL